MTGVFKESTCSGRVSLRVSLLIAGAVALVAAAWKWPARSAPLAPQSEKRATEFPTRLAPEEISSAEALREASPVTGGYRRETERPKPVQDVTEGAAKELPPAEPTSGGPSSHRRDEKKTLPEIFRMPAETRQSAPTAMILPDPGPPKASLSPDLSDGFAPYGRLIKCQLVNTVDSVTARSEPIVALVTQDLDWNGDVIIPAGTEAYSYARPEPVIDAAGVGRLVDDGEWTLVLPGGGEGSNGRELVLKARALDRQESPAPGHERARAWGLEDGADGLVGATLSTQDEREVRLFAAAALSGLAQGAAAVAERQQPAPGLSGVLGATQIAPTLGNAVAGSVGTSATELMNQVAGRIRDEMSKRGVYVRVPAGKAFYLFVEQTIDPRAAAVGLRLPAGAAKKG